MLACPFSDTPAAANPEARTAAAPTKPLTTPGIAGTFFAVGASGLVGGFLAAVGFSACAGFAGSLVTVSFALVSGFLATSFGLASGFLTGSFSFSFFSL